MKPIQNPQQLRISCNSREFVEIKKGLRTFEVKLTDARMPVQPGDLITIEERLASGEPTGASVTKKASCVVDTKTSNLYPARDVAERGLTIMGFVNPEYATLSSVYDDHFTMSIGIDKRGVYEEEDMEGLPEGYQREAWNISSGPHYTPAHLCPPFVETGILDGFHIEKWPSGRYSVTLLLYIDFNDEKGPPYEIHTVEAFALVYVDDAESFKGITVAMVDFDALVVDGIVTDVDTHKKVVPLDLHEVGLRLMSPMDSDEAHKNDLLTEADIKNLVDEARARGENVDEMERELATLSRLRDE